LTPGAGGPPGKSRIRWLPRYGLGKRAAVRFVVEVLPAQRPELGECVWVHGWIPVRLGDSDAITLTAPPVIVIGRFADRPSR
jgi:hypothetical protein